MLAIVIPPENKKVCTTEVVHTEKCMAPIVAKQNLTHKLTKVYAKNRASAFLQK